MSFVLPFLVVIANVLGAGMIVPQVQQLHRHRSVAGVSNVWVGVGVAMNLWWLAYALTQSLWGMIPVSAAGAVLYGIIAVQFIRIAGRRSLGGFALGFFVLGMAPLPVLLVGGWIAAGVAIGFSYAVQFAPAAITAVRSTNLDGISATTWAMALFEAVVWFVYGVAISDAALVIGGAGGTVMSTVILVQVWRYDRPDASTRLDSAWRQLDVVAESLR
ncbi:MAG: hypothetical protein ACR2PK_12740 [Acidimicrobiales bacterium]